MPDRTYTEQEVAALLKRAAALQAQAARRTERSPGLTLAELEAVAAETGLDPALLRQAAEELDEPGRPLLDRRAGTTATHVSVERHVPGALTPEAWEDVVAELRHRFDTDLGKMWGMPQYGVSATEQIGRTMEWKHTSLSGIETRVLIRPRGEQLHLRASQRVGWGSPVAEASTYGLTLAGLAALIAGAVVGSGGIALAVLFLSLFATVPLILYADRAWRRKKHRELDGLADDLAALAAGPPEAIEPSDVQEPEAVPKLDPALLDEDESAVPERSATRRRTREA
ncbi:MAG: hypothetical protein ACR2GR_10390 [Rhodothermales bacterium]